MKLRFHAAAAALVLALSACGGAAATGDEDLVMPMAADEPAVAVTSGTPAPPAPLGEGFGAAPKAKPKPKPTPTPSKAQHTAKPTRKPPVEKALPPPPPPPPPVGCKPKYVGEQASRAQAKQALTEAAGRTYWPNSAPQIRVPLNLVKATAWQESGWQSNIIACDGGVGLMQVMSDTAKFVNNRFDQSYDINNYRDNALLGANYLAWLIKYFGDVYFEGDYTLYTDGDCTSHTAPCLINAVVASYNFGFGAVDTDNGLVIPNPRYVENVRALMTGCECLSF